MSNKQSKIETKKKILFTIALEVIRWLIINLEKKCKTCTPKTVNILK